MHIPVLQKEVLGYLEPKVNENFIDATIGEAGHTLAILERNKPKGKVLGIELDPELYQKLKLRIARFSNRLILVNDSFRNLREIVKKENFRPVNGILFDLGMSSWHLEESKKGFSFQRDEPLDMRYNPQLSQFTAEEIVNYWPEKEIERILKEYGGERFAKRIAKKICKTRKTKSIKTTLQLVEIIKKSFPRKYKFSRIHCATRTFQALRIAVNDELNNLKEVLPIALEILQYRGRLVVISFHSGEDKIVKDFFRAQLKQGRIEILTKKPIKPTEQEIKTNPRSRSARLRAAIKL